MKHRHCPTFIHCRLSTLSFTFIHHILARNERESIQIAIRPKFSWGGSGIAGTVQVECTDLCSPCGARLVVGQSLTLHRIVRVLGVPNALVPLNMLVCQLNLFPGETTVICVSKDVAREQAPGQIIISATKAEANSTSQSLRKVEKHQLYKELRDCLDVVEPLEGKSLQEVIEIVKSASSSLRRVLLSPSFSCSFTNQVIPQLELWNEKSSGKYEKIVYVLPKHLDEKVATLHLGKLGAKLNKLTKDQANISVPVEGPYKPAHYMY